MAKSDENALTIDGDLELELVRSICLESYADFVREFWSVICPEPLVWNWHMEVLCQEIQIAVERVIARQPKEYDLVINVPPGSSKSTIGTIMLTPWLWAKDPSMCTLNTSYSKDLALDHAVKSRDIVRSERYQKCFPWVHLREDEFAKGRYSNTGHGMRYSAGVGGTLTGMHGHVLVVDDPLNPKEAASETELKACNDWMDGTLPTRCKDKAVTMTILIQQRLHEDDPSGRAIKAGKGWRVICLPAELGENVQPKEYRQFYVDGLLDPVRMPKEVLEEQLRKLGRLRYAGQYEQRPVPKEGLLFREAMSLFKDQPLAINWNKVVRAVRYWDKAGTSGGGCFTAGVLMVLYDDGSFAIGHVRRGQWGPFEREEVIKTQAKVDGTRVEVAVEQEGGSGGKFDAQFTIRNLAGYNVSAAPPQDSKEVRAMPFAAQIEGGNVRMVQGEWNTVYVDELMAFPESKFKDQVDASSGAFNTLVFGGRAGVF